MPRPYNTSLTPEQLSQRARAAAYARHARHGVDAAVAPMHRGRMAKYENEVDPKRELPEDERARRAQFALRRDMAKLALKSSRARSARAAKLTPTRQASAS